MIMLMVRILVILAQFILEYQRQSNDVEYGDSFGGDCDHNFTFSIIVDPTSTGGKLA